MKLIKLIDKREKQLGMKETIYRNSVRGISQKGNAVLMLFNTRKNEYKFPGGMWPEGEERGVALRREMKEETGYEISNILRCTGYIDHVYNDIYDEEKYFHQRTYYSVVELSDEYLGHRTTEKQIANGIKCEYVDIDKAIRINEIRLEKKYVPWVERAVVILKLLKENKI